MRAYLVGTGPGDRPDGLRRARKTIEKFAALPRMSSERERGDTAKAQARLGEYMEASRRWLQNGLRECCDPAGRPANFELSELSRTLELALGTAPTSDAPSTPKGDLALFLFAPAHTMKSVGVPSTALIGAPWFVVDYP